MYFGKFVSSIIAICLIAVSSIVFSSCRMSSSDESKVAEAAEKFGNHFFNYELEKASAQTTSDSRKWIMFFASNIDTATIDMINSKAETASINIDNIEMHSETEATAHITVRNFVWNSSIESRPEIIEEARFALQAVKEAGIWRIRMDSLRRNETQSRD